MTVSYAGKRCLVVGGAGFIGSHLVDALLQAGADHVTVMDNFFLGREENLSLARETYPDKFTLIRDDAAEFFALRSAVETAKPDIVFNLATKALEYSFLNPEGAFTVNTDIAAGLAELLRHEVYGRLVHVSSSEAYGTALYVPMDEKHPMLPETTYAAGKAAADLLLTAEVKMFDLDISIIRPFNNYGPRQNDGTLGAVIPLTIRRLLGGAPPVIAGDGSQTRDFIFVRDTVNALINCALLSECKGKTLNIGSGRETSILEIVRTLIQIMAYPGEITYVPRRTADVERHCADTRATEVLLGNLQLTTLEAGLRETLDWYREKWQSQ